MMSIEEQYDKLKKQLARTRMCLVAILLGLMLVCTVAATNGPFADLICRTLSVKDPNGRTTFELKESGDIKTSGKLMIQDVDVLAELKTLKDGLKTVSALPRYEVLEASYGGSNLLNGAGAGGSDRLVGTQKFSRPVKQVWVSISGVYTENSSKRPVQSYWFTGRGVVNANDRKEVGIWIGHHMSDHEKGSGGDGYIRVLVFGELEPEVLPK